MKRIFAHIGFSTAVTLLVLNLIEIKYVFAISAGLAVVFAISLALPKIRQAMVVPLCVGGAVFACLVLLCGYYGNAQPQLQLNNTEAATSFYIVDMPELTEDGEYIYIAKTTSVDKNNAPQNIKIRIKSSEPIDADYYQLISADLDYYSISDNAYGSFGYWGNNIFLSASIDEYTAENSYVKSPWHFILDLRIDVIKTLCRSVSADEGGLAAALITGNKSNISNDVYSWFKYAGTTHLMAVSGFHLTVIVGALLFILKRLRVNDRVASVLAILLSVLCIGLAGFSKSVIRAVIMIIIMLSGKLLNKRADALNSLGIAVFIICLNPFAVCDVSAQLSVLSVLSLLTLNPILVRLVNKDSVTNTDSFTINASYSPAIRIYSSFSVALSIIIYTLPVMYITFGYVSLAGLVSNIIVVPLGGVSIIVSVISYFCLKASFLPSIAAWICKNVNGMLICIVKFFAGFTGATVDIAANMGFAIAGVLIIFAICFFIGNRKMFKSAGLLSFVLIGAILVSSLAMEYNCAQILLCKNGAAAAMHNGKTVVYAVDSKSDYYAVRSFLFSGNSKIDLIILDDETEYALRLIDTFGCDTVVASDFDVGLLEYDGFDNISVCQEYANQISNGMSVFCNKNKGIDYCLFSVNNVTISLGDNQNAVIKASGNSVADKKGIIDLNNGNVVYSVYTNSTYKARRVDIWR